MVGGGWWTVVRQRLASTHYPPTTNHQPPTSGILCACSLDCPSDRNRNRHAITGCHSSTSCVISAHVGTSFAWTPTVACASRSRAEDRKSRRTRSRARTFIGSKSNARGSHRRRGRPINGTSFGHEPQPSCLFACQRSLANTPTSAAGTDSRCTSRASVSGVSGRGGVPAVATGISA